MLESKTLKNSSNAALVLIILFFSIGCGRESFPSGEEYKVNISLLGISNQSAASSTGNNGYSTSKMDIRLIFKVDNLTDTDIKVLRDSINYVLVSPDGREMVASRFYSNEVFEKMSSDTFTSFINLPNYLSDDLYYQLGNSLFSVKMEVMEITTSKIVTIHADKLRAKRVFPPSVWPDDVDNFIKRIPSFKSVPEEE